MKCSCVLLIKNVPQFDLFRNLLDMMFCLLCADYKITPCIHLEVNYR